MISGFGLSLEDSKAVAAEGSEKHAEPEYSFWYRQPHEQSRHFARIPTRSRSIAQAASARELHSAPRNSAEAWTIPDQIILKGAPNQAKQHEARRRPDSPKVHVNPNEIKQLRGRDAPWHECITEHARRTGAVFDVVPICRHLQCEDEAVASAQRSADVPHSAAHERVRERQRPPRLIALALTLSWRGGDVGRLTEREEPAQVEAVQRVQVSKARAAAEDGGTDRRDGGETRARRLHLQR
eukprot:6195023-Pleurochrysis_carterae.AAC.1